MNLEKKNKRKSHLRKLLNETNEEVTDPLIIRQELRAYYENLYKSQNSKSVDECLVFMNNVNTPKLSETDAKQCEGKLSIFEYYESLKQLANNKTPGNDGFSKEFYMGL